MSAVQPIHYLTRWFTPRVLRIVAKRASCEACGASSYGELCPSCSEKAGPHHDGDPYDVVGGEGGGLA
jgi:hypothetical protein